MRRAHSTRAAGDGRFALRGEAGMEGGPRRRAAEVLLGPAERARTRERRAAAPARAPPRARGRSRSPAGGGDCLLEGPAAAAPRAARELRRSWCATRRRSTCCTAPSDEGLPPRRTRRSSGASPAPLGEGRSSESRVPRRTCSRCSTRIQRAPDRSSSWTTSSSFGRWTSGRSSRLDPARFVPSLRHGAAPVALLHAREASSEARRSSTASSSTRTCAAGAGRTGRSTGTTRSRWTGTCSRRARCASSRGASPVLRAELVRAPRCRSTVRLFRNRLGVCHAASRGS